MTSSLWRNVGENTVTSFMTTRNRSRFATECVMECQQMDSCVSVAFDSKANICYLQPTYLPARQGDDGPPLRVYAREKVAECKSSEAPDVANAHVTKWRVTSTSLDCDVSCDEDYMLSEDETQTVRCQLDHGVWTTLTNATCKQFAWRNHTVKLYPAIYALPRPAKVGLCVRVKGTPTKFNRFTFNLGADGHDLILHFSPKLNDNTTVLNYQKDRTWSSQGVTLSHPSHPFPFAVGVPFEMVFTAVSLYKFRVQVNGVYYVDFTGGLPVTDVDLVYIDYDVSIEYLIFGCY
ncbi:hypothetical protein ACOMHN_052074 [Nucella lapillus]